MTDEHPPAERPAPLHEAERPAPASEEDPAWLIGGMLLSRKIDVVAFTALFLSIATITIQLSAYFKGARLTLLPPDQVFIRRDDSYTDKIPRARFGATLIYVNTGEKGYASIVRRESVVVKIDGKDFEQGWDQFVVFDGPKPKKGSDEPAKPFPVDGGDTKTHQTDFIPWPKRCPRAQATCPELEENHVHWDMFMNELRRLTKAGQYEYEFDFAAEVYGADKITASCKIHFDADTVDAIEMGRGYSPTCYADDATPFPVGGYPAMLLNAPYTT